MKLKGFANDYVGKGMNGKNHSYTTKGMKEDRSVVMGNTCLFARLEVSSMATELLVNDLLYEILVQSYC